MRKYSFHRPEAKFWGLYVQDCVDRKDIDTVVSTGWWDRFKQRHKHLTLRSAAALSIARARATDPDTIRDNNLLEKPLHIFNCDESSLPLNPKAHERGSKHPSYVTGNDKSQITILAMVLQAFSLKQ